ncbi:MAG: hypothetical protein ACK5S6_03390 [bacterium]|jgi:hypothetical protein
MELTNEQRDQILATHNALWDALYNTDSDRYHIDYRDETYDIRIPESRAYASAILPNSSGSPILWITQNLEKSTYGSMAILKARSKGLDLRITWLVDTTHSQFKYKGQVKTCFNDIGDMTDGHIEVYDSHGTDVLWTTNSYYTKRKAMF